MVACAGVPRGCGASRSRRAIDATRRRLRAAARERRVLREELARDDLDERDERARDREADGVRAEPGPRVHAVDLARHDLAPGVERRRARAEQKPRGVQHPDVADEGHVEEHDAQQQQHDDHHRVPAPRRRVEPRGPERARDRADAARDEHRAHGRLRRPAVGGERAQRRPEGDQDDAADPHGVGVAEAPPQPQVGHLRRLVVERPEPRGLGGPRLQQRRVLLVVCHGCRKSISMRTMSCSCCTYVGTVGTSCRYSSAKRVRSSTRSS